MKAKKRKRFTVTKPATKKKKANPYIIEMVSINDQALYPSGFDDAVVGIVSGPSCECELFLLSTKKIIQILTTEYKMSAIEAREYFEANIYGAYLGIGTPVYLNDAN